jgi:uncharacterized protein with GYD domain
MPHYLLQLAYAPEAWSALIANPQDRSKVVERVLENLGGKMERFWFSFGDYDIVGVVDLPESVSAAAFSMALSAGGACRILKTTPLLSTEEGLEAMKKAANCGYTPVHKKTTGDTG